MKAASWMRPVLPMVLFRDSFSCLGITSLLALFCLSGLAQSVTLVNPSFESPVAKGSVIPYLSNDGVSGGWSWTGTGGISGGWTSFVWVPPDGNQAAFLQNNATMSQTFTVAVSNRYSIYFNACGRQFGYPADNIALQLDGITIGYWAGTSFPGDHSFASFSVTTNISAGTHTLSFVGTPSTGDSATAIDSVVVGGYSVISPTVLQSDGSRLGTQLAVNAAQDGWTVLVPAGTNTWTSTLSITKAIQLIGAGIGQTIIVDGGANALQLISWNTVSNTFPRLSGFTFQGNGNGIAWSGSVVVGGTGHSFRIDHCAFMGLNNYAIFMHDWVYGVIDNCLFSNCVASLEVKMENYGGGTNQYGDGSWADADNWGTTNALYIENCSYWNNGALDGCDGARVVFRYNHITNNAIANHGTESSGRERSARLYEVYQNTFSWPTNSVGTHWADAVYIRGGTAVIFSNLITGGIQRVSLMAAYRDWNSPWPVWGNVYPGNAWDTNYAAIYDSGHSTTATNGATTLTDTSKNWTVNQWAGFWLFNTNGGIATGITGNTANTISCVSGYHDISGGGGANMIFNIGDGYQIYYLRAVLDQPGTGQGDLIADTVSGNSIPYDVVTGLMAWPNEAFDPIYIWGNTMDYQYPDSAYGPPVNGGASQSTSIIQGRDWIDGTPKPGYTPLVYPHPLTLLGGTNDYFTLTVTNGSGSGTPATPVYTLTVVNGTGSGSYSSGATVSITANTIPGKTFRNWSGLQIAGTNLANTTVTMPAANVTATANYLLLPPAQLMVKPGP